MRMGSGLLESVYVRCLAYELVKRSGERGGYLEGFNKGLDEGVNRGLRLFNTKAPETVVATQSETEANSPR